jgi:hypothetical protein
MDEVAYVQVRLSDWYLTVPRDEVIEDSSFCSMEQLFIYKDIYAPMKKPLRPMHPIDLEYLWSKPYFSVDVIEKMVLT